MTEAIARQPTGIDGPDGLDGLDGGYLDDD